MGISVSQLAPSDMLINMSGGDVHISCTIKTAYEAESVQEIIRILTKKLSSHREMLRGDIMEPKPLPTYDQELASFLGVPSPTPPDTAS